MLWMVEMIMNTSNSLFIQVGAGLYSSQKQSSYSPPNSPAPVSKEAVVEEGEQGEQMSEVYDSDSEEEDNAYACLKCHKR